MAIFVYHGNCTILTDDGADRNHGASSSYLNPLASTIIRNLRIKVEYTLAQRQRQVVGMGGEKGFGKRGGEGGKGEGD